MTDEAQTFQNGRAVVRSIREHLAIEDRDRARDIAVALEQENAVLLPQITRIRALLETVARIQPADPYTGDRDVSWLALLEALDGDW